MPTGSRPPFSSRQALNMEQSVDRIKTKVRSVFRAVRQGKWHSIVAYSVGAPLEGDNATIWVVRLVIGRPHSKEPITQKPTTQRSSLLILARMKYRIPDIGTDEYEPVKNITYFLSKTSPHILSAEERSSAPRNFLRFQNLPLDIRTRCIETEMTRVVKFEVDGFAGKDKLMGEVTARINELLVLKSAG
ncbi:hypothetical protein D9613_011953 [Agrocybe pediades]|uniref:Uncharacterized protein n=1 Tax=Agrocybe pediades TaxID=84607 RepID=A0A8H4QEZ8_9AGAR|nr:hypothetical protein D9613_011953 [Agrocybe pediades]